MEVGEQRMRVVAGIHGGRRISAPEGVLTRPTSDRVREALFSRLESLGAVREARVLDAFAGSGALGIEALSRGADSVVFIEQARAALGTLRENVDRLDLGQMSEIVRGDAFKVAYARRACGNAPYSLILLDPPYRIDKAEVRALIEGLRGHGLLVEGAIVTWEYPVGTDPLWPEGFESLGARRYGSTEVDIGQLAEENS